MLAWLLLWACAGEGEVRPPEPGTVSPGADGAVMPGNPQGPPNGGSGRPMPPGGGPGAAGQVGPPGGGAMVGGQHGGESGADMQDPCGFPPFHDRPAPEGPEIPRNPESLLVEELTSGEGGGYRPQVVVDESDRVHVVYYERLGERGELIRHRIFDGENWSEPVHVGLHENRNWGPDIVAREDGSLAVVFDHALEDFSSRGYLTTWTESDGWTEPEPLTGPNTAERNVEIGSGHIANASGDDLAYVWIGKEMTAQSKFRAYWRWRSNGVWSEPLAFTDGSEDAWHTNVERRPDGSVLAGFDVGTGGQETVLYIAEGRDGEFSTPENLTQGGLPGERPHFAFGSDGIDHITWFHKEDQLPTHIYVRSGQPGDWGAIVEPSAGYGGFHFDPDIAINEDGVRVLVWGWDAGNAGAYMVYSVSLPGEDWTEPVRITDLPGWGKPGLASIDVDGDGVFHVVWNQGVPCNNRVYYAAIEVEE